jgi:hypothetical protein
LKADSGADTSNLESESDDDGRFSNESEETGDSGEWSRQQKRVFHRTNTLLTYWNARDYSVRWITLTSSPESKTAGELSYSHQRLRQRVERARRAVCDPEVCPDHDEPTAHPLDHVDELEYHQVRTCEGPQGVIHTFWAWDRSRFRDGNHERELYVPQSWLSDQWADIHGTEVPLEPGELAVWPERQAERVEWLRREKLSRAPFIVDVRRVGAEHVDGEHAPERMAAYAASQYLGDHGEALEHMSWSHGRSVGGSIEEVWEKLKAWYETLDEAVEAWKRVIEGERLSLSGDSGNGIHFDIAVEPPPNLSVDQSASVTPPDGFERRGPNGETTVTSYSDGTGIESGEPMDWEEDRERYGQQTLTGQHVTIFDRHHRRSGPVEDW